jgi:hypothetical protein
MTRSAIVRSENTSSATTAGSSEVSQQESRPLRPSLSVESLEMADSMSAAVVPGAKLEATTWKGPALPFMLRPRDAEWEVTFAWSEVRAVARRLERSREAVVEEGREGGFGRWDEMLVLEDERCV